MSLISSFELLNVVLPNPNGVKALLTIGVSTFPTKGEPLFGNGSRSMPKNFSQFSYFIFILFYFIILFYIRNSDNVTLFDELFIKTLRILKACVLVNNNLCGKVVSSTELLIAFNESFKNSSGQFFITACNFLSCELENFKHKLLYRVNLY